MSWICPAPELGRVGPRAAERREMASREVLQLRRSAAQLLWYSSRDPGNSCSQRPPAFTNWKEKSNYTSCDTGSCVSLSP